MIAIADAGICTGGLQSFKDTAECCFIFSFINQLRILFVVFPFKGATGISLSLVKTAACFVTATYFMTRKMLCYIACQTIRL